VGAAIVLMLAALAVTVVIGMVRTATPSVEELPDAATVPAPLYVHIHGAVHRPGLYRFSAEARVVDVVAAAGGFTATADRDAVNLARTVTDGEQLHVPEVGEVASDDAASGDGRVNLNSADVAALDTLPRIGPALAERIIRWREDNGRFTSVEDLLAVPGIGDKMLQALRDLVTV
jgi:competence protein ComEA